VVLEISRHRTVIAPSGSLPMNAKAEANALAAKTQPHATL
jgi:hypothetical protein